MQEIWKPIKSVDGLMASSEGRVMVSPYTLPLPRGGHRMYGGQPTSGQWDGRRYIYRHKGKNYKIARLVCEAFNGPPMSENNVCMHLDENSRNNKPENLQWGTQRDNMNFPGFIKYCQGRTGENNPHIKGRKENI